VKIKNLQKRANKPMPKPKKMKRIWS